MNKNEFINSKICKNPRDVKFSRMLAYWRFKAEKIVFLHGDFDLLHFGNIKLLTQAAEYGTVLIVGINNTGKEYIHDAYERAFNVAALHYTDYVIFNNFEKSTDLIKLIKPDVFVHSGQQKLEKETENLLNEMNIKVKTFVCPEGFSNNEFKEKVLKFLK